MINKTKNFRIFDNAIEIICGSEKYVFNGFQNRDFSYRRVVALWKAVSPHAKDVEIETETD